MYNLRVAYREVKKWSVALEWVGGWEGRREGMEGDRRDGRRKGGGRKEGR